MKGGDNMAKVLIEAATLKNLLEIAEAYRLTNEEVLDSWTNRYLQLMIEEATALLEVEEEK